MNWTFSRNLRLVSYTVTNDETDGNGAYFNLTQGATLATDNDVASLGTFAFTNTSGVFLANTPILFQTGDGIEGRTGEPEAFAINNLVFAFAPLYWTGDQGSIWATNNAGNTNWALDLAGTLEPGTVPALEGVIFSATNAAPGPKTTSLGANFTINSLTITDPAPVTISDGTYNLTINAAGGVPGIDVQAGAGLFTLSTPLILGANQTFIVNNAAGAVIDGGISGAFGITKDGSGTLTLKGTNTYTGTTTVLNGTLEVGDGFFGNLTGGPLVTVHVESPGTLIVSGQVGAGTAVDGSGQTAVSIAPSATLQSSGSIVGGPGSTGTAGIFSGGTGGNGGTAVAFLGSASFSASSLITGGTGGSGGSATGGSAVGGTGGQGGSAVTLAPASTVLVSGTLTAGAGGSGGVASGALPVGGKGGDGGTAVSIGAGSSSTILSQFGVTGGAGGAGGAGIGPLATGGAGGEGGTAIFLGAGSQVQNQSSLLAGNGGDGGSSADIASVGGRGGDGGTAAIISAGASFTNAGSLTGGFGGFGGGGTTVGAPGNGGAGAFVDAGATLTNSGSVTGGSSRLPAEGSAGPGVMVNGGSITNTGVIEGGPGSGPGDAITATNAAIINSGRLSGG